MKQHTGRRNQKIGKDGERLAQSVLNGLGIEMLEKIGTPVLIAPYIGGRGAVPGVYYVKWGEKVSGDRRGILPGGRSVLIEVKTVWDGNLPFGQLDDHQHNALKRHASFGGLSLLVWVHNDGVFVMEYPAGGIPGFIPHKSITPARARDFHEKTVGLISMSRMNLTQWYNTKDC